MIEQAQAFTPDWISPPGETVEDLLEERCWTQVELAERTGLSPKHINDLVRGRTAISADMASRLDKVLGGTAQFWLTREAQYRAALERRKELDGLRARADWLRELPLSWMVKQCWIRKFTHKGEQVEECLRYFGVASIEAWRERYESPLTAFRAPTKPAKKPGAVAAWLRQVEREADKLACAPYDKRSFQNVLPSLRELTAEHDPAVFIDMMQSLCAACGVAVVFVPAPTGCPVHGATRWLGPNRAVLALTLRYKSNDQLWFSFFHEAAHILKHGKKLLVIEGIDGLDPGLEREADRFAADLLIPPAQARKLSILRTRAQIKQAARNLGLAPGVVLGRMQNEGWMPWATKLNDLKVRYEWVAPKDTAA